MKTLMWAALAALLLAIPLRASAQAQADDYGVLVMAHGGGEAWNRDVSAALAPLRRQQPLEIAFGMADATSLQAAVDRLEAQGVRRIGVVRLFISGESWYQRTAQMLGLEAGAPPRPASDPHAMHAGHAGHAMAFWRLDSRAAFAMSHDGLMDAPEMGEVLADRARELSRSPAQEDVLILAHGPEDDAEDARWRAQLDDRANAVRALGFRTVRVETLREDWPEKREAAEARIRGYVENAGRDGGRALVIPYRVQGFGPYADVLDGLAYASNGHGLVPHPALVAWVQRQAQLLRTRFPEAAKPAAAR